MICHYDSPSKLRAVLVAPGIGSAFDPGDLGLIPRLGRSPGGGHGSPFQHSCLKGPWTEEPDGL